MIRKLADPARSVKMLVTIPWPGASARFPGQVEIAGLRPRLRPAIGSRDSGRTVKLPGQRHPGSGFQLKGRTRWSHLAYGLAQAQQKAPPEQEGVCDLRKWQRGQDLNLRPLGHEHHDARLRCPGLSLLDALTSEAREFPVSRGRLVFLVARVTPALCTQTSAYSVGGVEDFPVRLDRGFPGKSRVVIMSGCFRAGFGKGEPLVAEVGDDL